MSDEYTVNLYFSRSLNKEEKETVDKRLQTAYFKDSIDEDHVSLWDYELSEFDEQGQLILFPHKKEPTFEEALQSYLNDATDLGVEWEDADDESTVYFSGWSCCYNAVKKEAKRIMKEF